MHPALSLVARPCLAGRPLAELPKGEQFSFDAPSYLLEFGDQGPFASPLLRVSYSSLTQPLSVFDINMGSGESSTLLFLVPAQQCSCSGAIRHTRSSPPGLSACNDAVAVRGARLRRHPVLFSLFK